MTDYIEEEPTYTDTERVFPDVEIFEPGGNKSVSLVEYDGKTWYEEGGDPRQFDLTDYPEVIAAIKPLFDRGILPTVIHISGLGRPK